MLLLTAFEMGRWSSPALRLELGLELHHCSPGFQAFGLRLDLCHWLSWVSSLLTAGLGASKSS